MSMTRLEEPLRRLVDVGARHFTLELDRLGLKLTEKGRRRGVELKWDDLVSGDAALASALNASLPGGRTAARASRSARSGRAARR